MKKKYLEAKADLGPYSARVYTSPSRWFSREVYYMEVTSTMGGLSTKKLGYASSGKKRKHGNRGNSPYPEITFY